VQIREIRGLFSINHPHFAPQSTKPSNARRQFFHTIFVNFYLSIVHWINWIISSH